MERISAWGELDAERSLLTATRAQWWREYFCDRPSGKELPQGWSLNILGPRQDGREELYRHLEFEMGVILPQIQPVMANFMEGRKVAYPMGCANPIQILYVPTVASASKKRPDLVHHDTAIRELKYEL